MTTLSLVMIARNESARISRCLESARPYVDDIVIADTGSTDNTKEIAARFGARIVDFPWCDHFAEARNFALDHSVTDWNLMLDADEYLIGDAGPNIREFILSGPAIGRLTVVSSFVDETGTPGAARSHISRLFPAGVQYRGRIHEQVDSPLPRRLVQAEIMHDGYFQTNKAQRNIPLLEAELQEHPDDAYCLYQLAKEYKGIGKIELALKYMEQSYARANRKASYHPLIVVELLYLLKDAGRLEHAMAVVQAESDPLAGYPDFHFVKGLLLLDWVLSDVHRNVSLLPEIERSYLRCLEIGEHHAFEGVVGTGSFAALHNLGVYYETTGDLEKAGHCYRQAASMGYKPSEERLAYWENRGGGLKI